MDKVLFEASERVRAAINCLTSSNYQKHLSEDEQNEVTCIRDTLPTISLASAKTLVAIFTRLSALTAITGSASKNNGKKGKSGSSQSTGQASQSTTEGHADEGIQRWQLTVDEFLQGCKFTPYVLPPKPVDPVIRATLERLRAEASNREYAKMVSTLAVNKESKRKQDRAELKDMGHSMGVGANILVTMATMFAAGFFTCSFAFDSRVWGVVGGLCLMVIGLLVEGSLFVLGSYQIDKHVEKKNARAQRTLGRTLAFPPPPAPLFSTPTAPITRSTASSRLPGSAPKSVWVAPKIKTS